MTGAPYSVVRMPINWAKEVLEMFSMESVEMFLFIGVITAGILWYGKILAKRESTSGKP